MKRGAWLILLVTSIACGSSESPPPAQPAQPAAQPATEGEEEHPNLTPELDAFHALLSPRWHADKGDARRKDTCAVLADFKAKAADLKAAPAPAGVDAAGWSTSGAELEGAVAGLETACAGSDPAAFESAFETVHTRFHHAMELVVGEHGH